VKLLSPLRSVREVIISAEGVREVIISADERVWALMGAPGICSEPNGAPGFAQPNGGFTGLTVGARELTHRIVLCKTFIYIYTILWTVRPYSRW
jgi:hypothetical protein